MMTDAECVNTAFWALRNRIILGTTSRYGIAEFIAIANIGPYGAPEAVTGSNHVNPWECLKLAHKLLPSPPNPTTVAGLEMFAVPHPHPLDTADELLRCPCCAYPGAYNDGMRRGMNDNYTVAVHCSNTSCGLHTPEHYKTRADAARAWNRRVGRRL